MQADSEFAQILLSIRWIPSGFGEHLSHFDAIRQVQLEHEFSYSTECCDGLDSSAFDEEMFIPRLPSRIEKGIELVSFSINRRDVGSFKAITIEARQREVIGSALAPMFRGNDVIRLVRKEGLFFRKQTILATSSGPFSHFSPQRRRDAGKTHDRLSL